METRRDPVSAYGPVSSVCLCLAFCLLMCLAHLLEPLDTMSLLGDVLAHDSVGPAAVSFSICALWCGVVCGLTGLLNFYPERYQEEPGKKILWGTTSVAMAIPPFIVPYYAYLGLMEFQETQGQLTMVGPSNYNLRFALGFSLGYMAFDTAMMVVFYKPLRKALKPALYDQMMYHHVLSLLLWPYAFYVEKCIVAIGYFLFTESSNFLLNLRFVTVHSPFNFSSALTEEGQSPLFQHNVYRAGLSHFLQGYEVLQPTLGSRVSNVF